MQLKKKSLFAIYNCQGYFENKKYGAEALQKGQTMIKEFKPGLKVEQIVIVRVQKVGNTSKGGIFARGLLEDNSGMIPFICFEAGIVERLRQLEAPKAMLVGGNVDINKLATDMSLQFFVQKLEAVQPKDDISGLLPAGNVDLKAYLSLQ